MNDFKTPLILISGFLGAGKTTFLRQLLPLLKEDDWRPHLVINDYGEAEIDAATLAELAATVRAINGTCVCCESQDEFLDLLANEPLSARSVLLVETNGTTDPYEIIESLGLDERAHRYSSPLHISIIDAQRWQKRWWHNELERLQVHSAGYHYLSKTDVASPERVFRVTGELREVNPAAVVVTPRFLAEELSRVGVFPLLEKVTAGSRDSHSHGHDYHHRHEHDHDHGEHYEVSHQFVSLQVPLPAKISRKAMSAWLDALPKKVIRAKGFVRLTESPDRLFSFQKVEDSHAITFLPLSAEFARAPLALLIGTGLVAAKIPKLKL